MKKRKKMMMKMNTRKKNMHSQKWFYVLHKQNIELSKNLAENWISN
jgi:hypothetical protein